MTIPATIRSPRLALVPVSVPLAQAELNDTALFSALLGATVPDDWPPDELSDARLIFLCLLEANPAWIGWLGWYAVNLGASGDGPGESGHESEAGIGAVPGQRLPDPPTLVGSVGFKGPPDPEGVVEIGYSILPAYQGRGLATEMTAALVQWAAEQGARLVQAQVKPVNTASIRVLERLGFQEIEGNREPGMVLFAREIGASRASAPPQPLPTGGVLPDDPDGRTQPEAMHHAMDECAHTLETIHREVDERARALEAIHRDRWRCGRGCCFCCVDEITVFEVEADAIRRHHADLLATGEPHAAGACAFLSGDGACRVYESRPYVCRTQGLPLRWEDETPGREPAELRDICPLNESHQPIEELPAEECWEIGPFEVRLASLQAAQEAASPTASQGRRPRRVRLRDLFARSAADSGADPGHGDPAAPPLDPTVAIAQSRVSAARPRHVHPEIKPTQMHGPRIYNLFPLLAGPVTRWSNHLDRIARMGFDWIYLNPVQYAGFSGSLYAIKDPYAYHLALHGRLRAGTPAFEKHLRSFIAAAETRGLRVMLDLVINHTSKDALLAEAHPEWYRHEEDGSLRSPSAIDPADARRVTVWGDLAELDYEQPASREGLTHYWTRFLDHALALGFSGFRCDAAYKVPAETWRALIDSVRCRRPDTLFCAETLGCRLEETHAVAAAGFDYLFNSSKWWDYRAPWCLQQYETHRHLAPSISFPETHDTPRLAEEADGRSEILRQRYLFAAAFSAGVMIPMGFEYAARRKLDVVHTRVSDRESVASDLTEFITTVNTWKASTAVLNGEGAISLVSGPEDDAVRLYKRVDGLPTGEAPGDGALVRDTIAGGALASAPGQGVLLWINPSENDIPVPESWLEEAVRLLGVGGERIEGISSHENEDAGGDAHRVRVLRAQEALMLRAVEDNA
jgi:GNAT superfamily N-acetyltransferase/Fe-S-cluster containining protein